TEQAHAGSGQLPARSCGTTVSANSRLVSGYGRLRRARNVRLTRYLPILGVRDLDVMPLEYGARGLLELGQGLGVSRTCFHFVALGRGQVTLCLDHLEHC